MTSVTEYAKICKDTSLTAEGLTNYEIVNTVHNSDSEFDARVYKQNNEIVICFQASMNGDRNDTIGNFMILLGLIGIDGNFTIPGQLKDAVNLYINTKKDYPNANISFTGHSYGGALAQILSYITGKVGVSFGTPGLEYVKDILTKDYISQNYNLTSSDIILSEVNIVNYTNMNDPIGNIGVHLGKNFLHEPNPIKNDEPIFKSPHENIDLFFEQQYINDCNEIDDWNIKHSGALFIYDINNKEFNALHEALKLKYSIDETALKEALDIINNEIGAPTHLLQYKTPNGEYILGTDDSETTTTAITGTNDFMWFLGGNDVIYANAGNDTINGKSGNDIIIGGQGNDTINGGDDNDIIIADYSNATISELQNIKYAMPTDQTLQSWETLGTPKPNYLKCA